MQVVECLRALYQHTHQHYCHAYQVKLYQNFESDFISVNRSGYLTEFEIKRSRSDFKADFKKGDKHTLIQHGELANRFYFCAPAGLLKAQDIPDYCGWIEFEYVDVQIGRNLLKNYRMAVRVIKVAPLLHKVKAGDKQLIQLMRSMAFRQLNLLERQTSQIEKERYRANKTAKTALG